MPKKDIKKEFNKYANDYNKYNIIQQIVSKALIREISFEPKRILELGSGSGQIFKNIDFDFDYYKGIDFSQDMCDLHPKSSKLDIICLDFDTTDFIDNIKNDHYDLILSASALQWSKDLDKIIKTLGNISSKINMVLFTANTFKTLFNILSTKSPILTTQEIQDSFSRYYKCDFEIINYKIEFDTKKELFNYIKNSGVGGGNNNLTYKEAKKLYQEYQLNYLEFEVIFVRSKSFSQKNSIQPFASLA